MGANFLQRTALLSLAVCFVTCCPNGWTVYDDSCYLFIVSPGLNWMEAQIDCHDKGANLVILEKSEETSWIEIHMSNNNMNHMWIGGRVDKSGTWRWTYGDSFHWPLIQDTNWAANEPNNIENDESCVEIYGEPHSGKWNDETCTVAYGYICETPHVDD